MSKKRTTINIENELLKAIQCECIKEEIKVSDLIERLFTDYLKEQTITLEELIRADVIAEQKLNMEEEDNSIDNVSGEGIYREVPSTLPQERKEVIKNDDISEEGKLTLEDLLNKDESTDIE